MGDSLVASTYGRALYEAAQELKKEVQILDEVTCLADLIDEEKVLREILVSPAVSEAEKKQLTEHVLRGRVSDEMINFLFVLIDKERVWHLPRIARYYRKLYDRDRGMLAGCIYSAVPLSDAQLSSSEAAMSALLGKNVSLENRIDDSLIGGVKIQAGGKMIDRSLKGELYRMLAVLNQQQTVRMNTDGK
jgi:ATP synthase F1 delta subunit